MYNTTSQDRNIQIWGHTVYSSQNGRKMGQIRIVDVEKLGAAVPKTNPDPDWNSGSGGFFHSFGGTSKSRETWRTRCDRVRALLHCTDQFLCWIQYNPVVWLGWLLRVSFTALCGSNASILYFRNFTLLYVPDNEATREVMRPFNWIFTNGGIKGFNDTTSLSATDQMLSYYDLYGNNIFAGIDFNGGNIEAGNVSLTIR